MRSARALAGVAPSRYWKAMPAPVRCSSMSFRCRTNCENTSTLWRFASSSSRVSAKVASFELAGAPASCTRRGLQHASRSRVRCARTSSRPSPAAGPAPEPAPLGHQRLEVLHRPPAQRLVQRRLGP